jgi:hypothetical protein
VLLVQSATGCESMLASLYLPLLSLHVSVRRFLALRRRVALLLVLPASRLEFHNVQQYRLVMQIVIPAAITNNNRFAAAYCTRLLLVSSLCGTQEVVRACVAPCQIECSGQALKYQTEHPRKRLSRILFDTSALQSCTSLR